jgi:3-oxoacyl-[acyl-carrier-protein] synthase II
MITRRRVVLTGIGMVSPLGMCTDTNWKAMLQGKSGITAIEHLDDEHLKAKVYGPVHDYSSDDHFSPQEQKKMDPFIQYAVLASREAMQQASFAADSLDFDRCGVAIGSGIGGLTSLEENHVKTLNHSSRKMSPFFLPATLINMVSGYVSIEHGFRGMNLSVVSACATGTHNIGLSYRSIAYGESDVMIAGGAEKGSCILGIGGFAALRGLSFSNDDPATVSRPFDETRNGFVLSDGAAVMVLESYEHAVARGANILAEVVGFGMNADAHHITQPSGDAQKAMALACKEAGIQAEEVDCINAHATSTPVGDSAEIKAINSMFANKKDKIKVVALKSMLGHMLGAAGAAESVISIKSLIEQKIPGTINCDQIDSAINFDLIQKTIDVPLKYVLKNSFGFGGTNASLLFKRYDTVDA